jgi:hypothetical protein
METDWVAQNLVYHGKHSINTRKNVYFSLLLGGLFCEYQLGQVLLSLIPLDGSFPGLSYSHIHEPSSKREHYKSQKLSPL